LLEDSRTEDGAEELERMVNSVRDDSRNLAIASQLELFLVVKDFLTKPSFAVFKRGLTVEPEVGFPGAGQFGMIV
jgi:hypothetical protein